jgi:ABC-type hemin transport system substrate-binding protein
MTVINTDYYTQLIKQIDDVTSCAELQLASTAIIQSLQKQLQAAEDQLAKVQPLLDLLTPPASPDDIINWITGLIDNLITPLAAPALSYQIQIVAMTASLAEVIDKINEKASLFTDCEITP